MGEKLSKNAFYKLATQVHPTCYVDYPSYFRDLFAHLKKNIRGYTGLMFNQDMGLGDCQTMHLVINGKRSLSIRTIRKICPRIGLKNEQRRYLIKLVGIESLPTREEREQALEQLISIKQAALPTQLKKNQLEFFKHWYNGAIIELLLRRDASDDPDWIAGRLIPRVTPGKIRKSLALLQELGYLVHDEKRERLYPTMAVIDTGPEVRGHAVMVGHQQLIQLAGESVSTIPPDERHIAAVTASLSERDWQKVRDKVEDLRNEIIRMAVESPETEGDRIAQVNFQLFPLEKKLRRGRTGK